MLDCSQKKIYYSVSKNRIGTLLYFYFCKENICLFS